MNKWVLVGLGAAALWFLSGSGSSLSPSGTPSPSQTQVVITTEDLNKNGAKSTVAAINKRLQGIGRAKSLFGLENPIGSDGKSIHSEHPPMPASWSTAGTYNSGAGYITVGNDGVVSYSVN